MNSEQTTETDTVRACMSRWPIATLLCGVGVGAALMYFLDPSLGSRRRALVGRQVKGTFNDLEGAASSKARDIKNRAKGVLAETHKALTGTGGGGQPPEQQPQRDAGEDGKAGSRPRAA